MDQLSSIIGGDKAGSHIFYIQQELFNYWNARLPSSVLKELKNEIEKSEYNPTLYLDLFDPLFGLNKEQINLLRAPQKIIAVNGASGTGKSAMLAILAAYWIKQRKYEPGEILIITLTEKEMAALKLNLENMIGDQAAGVMITTFEKISFQLLSGRKHKITRLYNKNERIRFLSLVFPFLSSLEIETLSAYLETYHKAELTGKNEEQELAEAYLSSLEKIGAYDTAVLVSQTYKFLIGNPGILANFKQQYKALLIDDFQDITSAKYKMLSLFINEDLLDDEECSKKRKVIIFNDHHQAIHPHPAKENPFYYKFLTEFAEKELILHKNHRTQKNLHLAARTLAKSIHQGIRQRRRKTRVNTAGKKGTEINLFRVENKNAEAALVSEIIHSLLAPGSPHHNSEKINPGDIAVLSRNRGADKALVAALQEQAVPYYIHLPEPIIHRLPFSCIFSFFHFMLNEKDITSLTELLLSALQNFTLKDVQGIFLAGNRKEESLAMLVNRLYTSHQLTDAQYTELTTLLTFMKKLKNTVNHGGIPAALELILNVWKKLDLRTGSGRGNPDLEYELLFARAYAFENQTIGFLQSFYLESNALFTMYKKERVHLLDFAAARGLDFKIIFITGLEEGNCPCYVQDLELEYRLFYLAFTRARERVILTSCLNHEGKQLSLSSFTADLGLTAETINPEIYTPRLLYEQPELAADSRS